MRSVANDTLNADHFLLFVTKITYLIFRMFCARNHFGLLIYKFDHFLKMGVDNKLFNVNLENFVAFIATISFGRAHA